MTYIPNTDTEREEMLKVIGVESFEELFSKAVPDALWKNSHFELPDALSEPEIDAIMSELSSRNLSTSEAVSFMGAGVYNHYIPSAVNALIFRSEFYTAYTPYQAEVSQGTLQSIFEYQTMISELMGMEISNASMYDGAAACAEAALLAASHTRRSKILVPRTVNPTFLDIIKTYLYGLPIDVLTIPATDGVVDTTSITKLIDKQTAAVFIQQPNFIGLLEDVTPIIEAAKDAGALSVMVADPVSLGLLKSPGEYGADIAVAEGQPLGIPQALGGPLLGIMAVNKGLVRKLPGRLVGRTTDSDGNAAYCLTLQTREQHIRRDKATSNICTNQALCALAATIYLSLLGAKGLKRLGELCVDNSHYAYERIKEINGFSPVFETPFFREFVVETSAKPSSIIEKASSKGVLPGVDLSQFNIGLDHCLMMAFTELTGRKQVDKLIQVLSEI